MTRPRRTPPPCVERLRVLADPTRFAIVQLLLAGPRRVGELQADLGIEQSLLSHHLRTLREAGFVTARREGKGVRYRLAPRLARPGRRPVLDLGCCRLCFA